MRLNKAFTNQRTLLWKVQVYLTSMIQTIPYFWQVYFLPSKGHCCWQLANFNLAVFLADEMTLRLLY